MNRIGIVVAAAVVFVIAVVTVVLGQNLILPLPTMIERGAGMPWYLTWAMIWLTVACAVVLGGFLMLSLVRNPNRP
jgi:hypothetical protein